MESTEKETLQKVAHTVRALSVDAIQKANSGHPGLPLGAAEFGSYLYAKVLRHNPANPDWLGRDRFVLSAGHGSMFLYSLLHLTGYGLTMDDIRSFRTLHSKTPGHPEHGEAPGVETTTGPLGQGVACGVGMAIAQKLVAARFGQDLFDSKVWILAGDGCMMEGISSETSCLAGTLGLSNLVLIYDANRVCLDGPLDEVSLENTAMHYEAYGFRVISFDGYDWDEMEAACRNAREESNRPVLLILRTLIGKYATSVEGTWKAHGGALAQEDVDRVKEQIGWTHEPFTVPAKVKDYFSALRPAWSEQETRWNESLEEMLQSDRERAALWPQFRDQELPENFAEKLWKVDIPQNLPTRKCNEYAINRVASLLPWFFSGSADVSSCDFTWILDSGIAAKDNFDQRQIKFGVREFGMAACAYGMSLHGLVQPAVGTFLTFSDYMRNAMRLAALMKQRVIFVFSHDSVFLAEDGPTHQPVEHLMSLRLMPNLTIIRPGDENEVKAAWSAAFKVKDGPVAICFTRQDVESTVSDLTLAGALEGVRRGAYTLYGEENGASDILIIATGSEIHPAVGAARILESEGTSVRVVSMPSWELFDAQTASYRDRVLSRGTELKVSVEARAALGWQKYIGDAGLSISVERFGASAPADVLAEYFGFTAEKIALRIRERLGSSVLQGMASSQP